MAFNREEFIKDPTAEQIQLAKKSDLLTIGQELELEVKRSMRKQELLNILILHYIEEGIFEETAEALIKDVPATSELQKLQLQLEITKVEKERQYEQKRLEMEIKERK